MGSLAEQYAQQESLADKYSKSESAAPPPSEKPAPEAKTGGSASESPIGLTDSAMMLLSPTTAPLAIGARLSGQATASSPTGVDTLYDTAMGARAGFAAHFDDEIAGAVGWLKGKLGAGKGGSSKGEAEGRAAAKGSGAPMESQSYAANRDRYRAELAASKERSPIATGAGELGATALSIPLMGAGARSLQGAGTVGRLAAKPLAVMAGEGIGTGSRLAQAGKLAQMGAVTGGVEGAGASEADTPAGVMRDTAKGAAIGGVSAPLLGVAGEGATKALGASASAVGRLAGKKSSQLADAAVEQRIAAAGAERGAMKQLRGKPGGLQRYAKGMEEMGIGREGVLPNTVEQHLETAQAAQQVASDTKNAIAKKLGDAGASVNGVDIAARVRGLKAGTVASEQADAALEETARKFEQRGRMSWAEANAERQSWGNNTNFDAGSVKAGLAKKVYGKLNEALQDSANAVDKGAGDAWRKANEHEHVALKIQEIAANKLNKAGNRAISPSDYAMGGAGLAMGGGPGAAAGVMANKIIRGREHAVAAAAAEKASAALGRTAEVMQSAPRSLAKMIEKPGAKRTNAVARVIAAAAQSPDRAAVEHFVQSETDPDYRQASLTPEKAEE